MSRFSDFVPLREDFEEPSFLLEDDQATHTNQTHNHHHNNNNRLLIDKGEDDDTGTGPDGGSSINGTTTATTARMDEFTALGVKERDKIVDNLDKENFALKLRIFYLEEQLKTHLPELSGLFTSDKHSYENPIEAMEQEIDDLMQQLADSREGMQQAEREIDVVQEEAEELRRALQDAEEKNKELVAEQEHLKEFQDQVADVLREHVGTGTGKSAKGKSTKLLNTPAGALNHIRNLLQENKSLTEELAMSNEVIDKMESALNDAEKQRDQAHAETEKLKGWIQDLEDGVNGGREEADRLRERVRELQVSLDRQREEARVEGERLSARLKESEAIVDSERTEAERMRGRVRDAEVARDLERKEARVENERLRERMKEMQDGSHGEVGRLEAKVREMDHERQASKGEIERLLAKVKELEAHRDDISRSFQDLRSMTEEGKNNRDAEIRGLYASVDDLQDANKKLSRRLTEQMDQDQGTIEDLTRKLDKYSKREGELIAETTSLKREISELSRQVAELRLHGNSIVFEKQKGEQLVMSQNESLKMQLQAQERELRDIESREGMYLEEIQALQQKVAELQKELSNPQFLRDEDDERINHYETQLAIYRQQICDFERLSRIASDEMSFLHEELESQTRKIRDIEERFRFDNGINTSSIHHPHGLLATSPWDSQQTLKVEEFLEAETGWKKIIEVERARWKITETNLEARVLAMRERIGTLERMVEERDSVVREVEGRARNFESEDIRLRGEVARLSKELESKEWERQELLQKSAEAENIRTSADDARREVSRLSEDVANALREKEEWREKALNFDHNTNSQLDRLLQEKQSLIREVHEWRDKSNEMESEVQKCISECKKYERVRHCYQLQGSIKLNTGVQSIDEMRSLLAGQEAENHDVYSRILNQLLLILRMQGIKEMIDLPTTKAMIFARLSDLQGIRKMFTDELGVLENRFNGLIHSWSVKFDTMIKRLWKFEDITKKASANQKTLKEHIVILKRELSNTKQMARSLAVERDGSREAEAAAREEISRLEIVLRDAEEREAVCKEMVQVSQRDVAEWSARYKEAEERMAQLDDELKRVREFSERDKLGAAERVEEVLEQMRLLQHKLDMAEKHYANAKDKKALVYLGSNTNNDDHFKLISANEKLRADFMEAQKVLEDKESQVKYYKDLAQRLELSRVKHITREETCLNLMTSAIKCLEKFNDKQEGMKSALSLLKSIT
ncbi:hypothetical protein HDU76_006927 [Blyttiomyces sp. JEL0837]|nr:hypothetical protein HDU76_006927 [Blyttiomyces sp. JEL0837]